MKKDTDFNLFGLFGYPLAHTFSPAIHEAAFKKLGLNANYVVLELSLSEFKKTMRHADKLTLSGFNVTVPYKEVVMPYLSKVLPEAKAIGAVNTVFKKKDRWIGTNTDMEGFVLSLKKDGKFSPKNKRAVMLGAGGAARAVAYGLSKEGVKEILIVECFLPKAEKIKKDLKKYFPKVKYEVELAGTDKVKEAIQNADLLINATPLGLKPQDPKVVAKDWIPSAKRKKVFCMDLIYNPAETPFLKDAKARGQKTLNGLGMLLYQGARAFERWTNLVAPVAVMREALFQALKASEKK